MNNPNKKGPEKLSSIQLTLEEQGFDTQALKATLYKLKEAIEELNSLISPAPDEAG